MKLTAKIAMCYPNAHVTLNGYDVPIFKIDEIDFKHDEFTLMRVSDGDIFHEPIYKCQLILTPLDKISDVDAVEVAKIADKNVEYKKGNGHIAEITRYKVVKSESKDKSYIGIDRYSGDTYYGYDPLPITASLYSIEQIDYLRSKGYDCGYANLNSLIAAGVAVEKEIV